MGQHECPRPRLVEDSPLIWADVGVVLEVDRTASLDPMPRGPTLVVDFVEDHGVMKATRAQSPGGFLVPYSRTPRENAGLPGGGHAICTTSGDSCAFDRSRPKTSANGDAQDNATGLYSSIAFGAHL